MHLYGTQNINKHGHLTIGGVDTIDLAKTYGTPLFVYDVDLIRQRAKGFIETFEKLGVKAEVAYASKAFSCIAMYQLAQEERLSLDVVSGGELFTAIKSGFPSERIHFHGNNKSYEEIVLAFDTKIGCIVVDNFYEIQLIKEISQEKQQTMKILLRVTPGVEAHTHDFITTGQADSKFGFDINNGQADRAFKEVVNDEYIELLGLHCHIGSQIFETDGFSLAAEKLMEKIGDWYKNYEFECKVLNLGGGFGIRYTEDDQPLEPQVYVEEMIKTVQAQISKLKLTMPEIWIEPGRSLVGDAGTSLYTIGSHKNVPGIRDYIAVDGGMSDNIRPALYDAKYEAVIANKVNEEKNSTYTVAGKLCESGDKLIVDATLQQANSGDTLAIFCTGAYGYSMASNYNRVPRPAVVFVESGEHQLVIQRESYENIIQNDLPLALKKGVKS
ncbi:diaminopimelate decarboxylase [Ureibacillus composti]|nr:diaminopimelate decarboxylase [Ureibacillus composti]